MMRLGIRCDGDAGQEAGTGHVYRSLEYARLLMEQFVDLEVRFIMRDFPEGLRMVKNAGHDVTVLPASPSAADMQKAFADYRPRLLVIDTLGCDEITMDAAKAHAERVVTFDDLGSVGLQADVVINGILWATKEIEAPAGGPEVYQGVDFMPLRTQFANAWNRRAPLKDDLREIVVCTGGHDETGFAPKILSSLALLPFACRVVFCAGPSHEGIAELQRLALELSVGGKSFEVQQEVTNMADVMLRADLAILTGGTVLFEASACGLPSIIICSQEHQVPQAQWFAWHNAAVSLGFMEQVDGELLLDAVVDMDKERRHQLSKAASRIVDGRGMERVVEILSSCLS